MYLRRLDLVGFKSFATRTATDFQPGIVVVVGPNGSGKSNIADAVLWVLGEQSAKAVRARKPEEVIFAGSAQRQPLGMAEVSLVLDNTDASLPIEYEEVRVTRRLFRSGDSEYLLNGARVRLKDITQLLLHARLSPDSYTVIGQGSIDELILQRPDERRLAFENVADIRRHQIRLLETRSKLATTQANLVRVQDVLAELTPHVRRLKVQVDRARKSEAFRAELSELLLKSYRWRLLRAHAEQRQAEQDSAEATAAAQQAEAETVDVEEKLRELDASLVSLEARLGDLRPRADGLREQLRVAERAAAVARERMAGLEAQRRTAELDLEEREADLARLTEEAEAALTSSSEPEASVNGEPAAASTELLRERLAAESAALEAAQDERGRLQLALDAADARIRSTEERLARTEQHAQSLEASRAVEQARQMDRRARVLALEERLAALAQEAADLGQRSEHSRERLQAFAIKRARASDELETAREALRAVSQQADRLQGALAALGAPDLKRTADADLPPTWQTALEDLPVVGLAADLATRIRPIDLLLRGYLRRIVVLRDQPSARAAHQRLSDVLPAGSAAWAVLSLDGVLLAAPGERPLELIGEDGQSVLADWTRQVHELEQQLAAAESARRAALATVQNARDRVDDAEADERTIGAALGELQAQHAELQRSHAATATELQQLQLEEQSAESAAEQRTEELTNAAGRAQAARDDLAAARSERAALTDQLRAVDQRLAELSERVQQLRTELSTLEAAAGRREAERAARAALHERIQAEIASNAAAGETARLRLDQLRVQQAELTEHERQLAAELQALQTELGPLETELEAADEGRAGLLADRQTIEQRLAVLRAAERSAHELREARHVAAQRAADEVERLDTEISETAELHAEVFGGASWAEQLRLDFLEQATAAEALRPGFHAHDTPAEAFDIEAARRRIAVLQRELRAVGGVADSVVEEYREMSDRHTFLEQQSADLRAAMTELENAATELESHMRDRFSDAFSAVQQSFADTFVELFGGGEARLVLTEPDDLLHTGVDIVARPPGKKLQGLLSLSGGERALTIVSLLFGLLKINPTPFCVLDEVDAALDEANVQRFANVLAEFSRQIQFIVVTHNRATMDKADAMYGVSMDAAGISHIFSVKPRALVAAGVSK